MGYTALLTALTIGLFSHIQLSGKDDHKGITLKKDSFSTSAQYNIGSFAIMLILVALYAFFWS